MYILRSQIILQPKKLEAPSHSHSQVECDLVLSTLTSVIGHSLKTNYRESGSQYVPPLLCSASELFLPKCEPKVMENVPSS